MTMDLRTNVRRRTIASWATAIASAAGILLSASTLSAAEVKTLEPGKLTIGMNGDMPMTQIKDGQLSGTDGELMVYVAKKLGLEPNPVADGLGGGDRSDQAGQARRHAWRHGLARGAHQDHDPQRSDLLFRHAAGAEGREQLLAPSPT